MPPASGPRRSAWRAPLLAVPSIYALALLLHAPLLKLPYFWDEAGYFVPASLDLLRHGWWVSRTTPPNGHPPLVMAWLALLWKTFGFAPLVTRGGMLVFYALLLWGAFRLGERFGGRRLGIVTALLLACWPIAFAQATLAQLDLAAACFWIWALVFRYRDRPLAYAVCAAAGCLSKDTLIILPFALGVLDLGRCWRAKLPASVSLRRLAPHFAPALALLCWFAYYHHVTGFWVGNPQYLSYNVQQAASLPRMLMALARRVWQLAGYQGVLPVTVLAAAAALWPRLRKRVADQRSAPHAPAPATEETTRRMAGEFALLIAVSLLFHAAVGGAVLARYLLPVAALYFVLCARQLLRLRWAWEVVALCVAVLVANWFWNPPYPFPYEDNLAYASFIQLQQRAAADLEAHRQLQPVLSAWPATDELSNPDLGYVRRPLRVVRLENFTLPLRTTDDQPLQGPAAPPQKRATRFTVGTGPAGGSGDVAVPLQGVAASPASAQSAWNSALLYSREYQPAHNLARLFPWWQRVGDKLFQHQPPLKGPALLRTLRLRHQFSATKDGQWAIVASRR